MAENTPNFEYLVAKDPSSLHHALKAYIEDHGGPEVDLKTIQAVLSAHGKFQKSDYNKNREEYTPRSIISIYKGGKTTADRREETYQEYVARQKAEKAEPKPKAEPKAKAEPKDEPKAEPKAATTTRRRRRTTKATADSAA